MRRGRGMSAVTLYNQYAAHGYLPPLNAAATAPAESLPDYSENPQIGDTVSFAHQVRYQPVQLTGTVIRLLEKNEDHQQHRPADVAKKRWLVSKNYVGCKRVIVQVDRHNDLPLFYTVTYARYAKNHFHVVKRAEKEQVCMNTQTPVEQRIEIVNKIVAEISLRGRNFFKGKHGKTDGHFLLKGGKLYWWEEYHNKPMRPISRNRDMCSHGGGLWYQLLAFTKFIETGERLDIYSDHWGYPDEDVKSIHELARKLGYLDLEDGEEQTA